MTSLVQLRPFLLLFACSVSMAGFSPRPLAASPHALRPSARTGTRLAPRPASHTVVHTAWVKTSPRHPVLRRSLWTPVFRPSRDSMIRQNEEIDRAGLPRIQNEDQLQDMVATGDLVAINSNQALRVDPRLDPDRRYCRPWTLDFVKSLSQAFYRQFHAQIQINSAVRTVEVQKQLRRYNANAAPETGDLASSHLAGITVDIQRLGMTMQQIHWVEQYMLPLSAAALIEVEEERHQSCFHVMVSERYADARDSELRAGAGVNE